MTTAFVLSGGANLGAAQVGMLAALAEAGVRPDMIVGTSVGAINGAWLAGGGDIVGLRDIWLNLRRRDVFPTSPMNGLLGGIGRSNHLVPDTGIRRLLDQHLRFRNLEDAAIPLHVVAAEVLNGHDVLLSRGPAKPAILASTAIPGLLPTVKIGGVDLMDGGVVNNAPISHAYALGATQIWVLATGYSCALDRAPHSALAMALHAVTLTIHQRLARDVERYDGHCDLRVIPPLCPIKVGPSDFSQAEQLIDGAYRVTQSWLSTPHTPGNQSVFIEPHRHGPPTWPAPAR